MDNTTALLGGKIVALEGNVGTGKSTLALSLEKGYPNLVRVYKEPTNENFLQLFYDNPKKYAFALQIAMVKTRIYQSKLAQRDGIPSNSNLMIWDRSMIGDYIFAAWNYLTGSISDVEMDVYEIEFGVKFNDIAISKHTQNVSIFLFLNDESKECKERVESMRQNKSEENIPLDYYNGLDDLHFTVCLKLCSTKNINVAVLNWEQYSYSPNVMDLLCKLAKGYNYFGKVEFLEGILPPKTHVIYDTPKSIYDAYNNPKSIDDELLFYVYISQSICQISTEELLRRKIVGNSRYNIKFYENEYKRVVMRHLSCGRTVVFY